MSPLRPFPYRLYFIRHGETDWNVAGRLQGQMDVPLNGRGRDQAACAGRALRSHIGADFANVIADTDFCASPMLRACETMKIARAAMGLSPRPFAMDDRLKEIAFGQWEGMTWAAIKQRDPLGVKERNADKWGFVPPDGESYALLTERVKPWLESLSGDTIAVSHGGVARVFLTLLAGMDPDVAPAAEIIQGRVLLFEGGTSTWL